MRSGVDEGVRLGLGKQEQDDQYTNAENIQRRMLETEIQANEAEDRKERREVSVLTMATYVFGFVLGMPMELRPWMKATFNHYQGGCLL